VRLKSALLCIVSAFPILMPAANVIDCSKKLLAAEVEKAKSGDTVTFTGVCAGPIVIRTDNLTLNGTGTAVIVAKGADAVVIAGAHGITLTDFEIRESTNGVVGQNGAHVVVSGVTSLLNKVSGISLQTGSSGVFSNVTVRENLLHGLDLQTGSSALVEGTFQSIGNRVFGINVNGSSVTFAKAAVTLSGNALGMQVATAGNAFLNDSTTVLNATNNLATGVTIVSGAHMVSFGGKINATDNGGFGVSVNSKAGLDLDAGSVLTVTRNSTGLGLQQQSVMTIFNNPQFSGAQGFSSVIATGNRANGLSVLTGSTLTLANQAQINSTGNGAIGLVVDNGSGITLRNTTLTGNTVRDLRLSFGSRLEVQEGVTIGTTTCDATVLLRGAGFICPN
jgi:hypothetical protein